MAAWLCCLIAATVNATRKLPAHVRLMFADFGEYALVCLVRNLLPL
jgi:hypothetical protein